MVDSMDEPFIDGDSMVDSKYNLDSMVILWWILMIL